MSVETDQSYFTPVLLSGNTFEDFISYRPRFSERSLLDSQKYTLTPVYFESSELYPLEL